MVFTGEGKGGLRGGLRISRGEGFLLCGGLEGGVLVGWGGL